jgi:hypothetical protein
MFDAEQATYHMDELQGIGRGMKHKMVMPTVTTTRHSR